MVRRWALALLGLAIITTSCFYGNFQGARTIGEGKINARTYVIVPAYLNQLEKKKIEEGGGQITEYIAGMYVQYGATRRLDVGLQANGYSFGFHVKWQATPGNKKYNFAPIIWLNYMWASKSFAPKISLVNSLDLSKSAQLYLAYEGFYAPKVDYSKLFSEGDIDWSTAKNHWFDDIAFGIDITFGRNSGAMAPFGLSIELAYPIANVKAHMILFGLGFSY